MSSENCDVLIVGGSTVGLCTALFLSRSGIRTRVVERNPAPQEHPRTMGIGPRTVEILRAAGLADMVDAQCVDMTGNVLRTFATPTLAEADLDALARQAPPSTDVLSALTPQTLRGTCPQGGLDQVFLDALRAAATDVEFGTELLGFTQDDEGVTAQVLRGGETAEVRARYLVAADGAGSSVREWLGIPTSGPGNIDDPVISVLFRADLTPLTQGNTFVLCDITTPRAPGLLLPVDGSTEWTYQFRYPRDGGLGPGDFTPQQCAERIREALGPTAGVIPEVVSILPWQVRDQIAERFRSGRIFLAGDAAHVIPPIGAFGLNTGVADAHNLAWKLAHVLHGTAGSGLLDTYEAERLPVARTTLEQAMLRLSDPSLHWASGPEGRRRRAEAGALNGPVVHLGYRYDSAAVCGAQPDLPSGEDVQACLDGVPGSRLPHHWVPGEHGRISTLDLVEDGFTLLAGPRGQAWIDAFGEAASRMGTSVAGHRIPVGVEESGAVLVRPDGFVAWRARDLDDKPGNLPERVLAGLLHRRQERP